MGHAAKHLSGRSHPGQGGELVDRSDYEGRQALIKHLVDSYQRQGAVAREAALAVAAADPELLRVIGIG